MKGSTFEENGEILISLNPSWESAKEIAIRFATSLVGPHNPWWLDLPIEWVPALLQSNRNQDGKKWKSSFHQWC